MDVHVHPIRGQLDKQEQGRELPPTPLVARRAVEQRHDPPVAEKTSIDEHERLAPTDGVSITDHAPHRVVVARIVAERHQKLGQFAAEQLFHPCAQPGVIIGARVVANRGRRIDQGTVLVGGGEADCTVVERVGADHLQATALLGRCLFQELTPRRNVIEERRDLDTGAPRVGDGLSSDPLAPLDAYVEAIAALDCGLQIDFTDGGDRRQRLATEAQRADRLQILEPRQLAGRVSTEGQYRILGVHADAIVADAQRIPSSAAQAQVDLLSSRVEGILDQFLDHRCRSLHDLAGGDLADQVIRERADTAQSSLPADHDWRTDATARSSIAAGSEARARAVTVTGSSST